MPQFEMVSLLSRTPLFCSNLRSTKTLVDFKRGDFDSWGGKRDGQTLEIHERERNPPLISLTRTIASLSLKFGVV